MNVSEDKDVVAAEKVSFETLRAYLRAKGWRVVESLRHDVETFAQLEGDNIVEAIQLPPGESDRHVAYVLDAARAIANFEGTSLDDALQALKVFGRDRVSCRLASASVEDGTVPLGDAVSFLANISKIFSAAVKDVVRPESYHKKVVSSEINELMDSARFGQTERGSFVVNVFMPLPYRARKKSVMVVSSKSHPCGWCPKFTRPTTFMRSPPAALYAAANRSQFVSGGTTVSDFP